MGDKVTALQPSLPGGPAAAVGTLKRGTLTTVPGAGLLHWPHLPTHGILALLLTASLGSWLAGHASSLWAAEILGLWVLYALLFWLAARLRNPFHKDLLRSGATIGVMMTLYLLLGRLAFAVIPWNGDRLVAAVDLWLGGGVAPVVSFGELFGPRGVEVCALIYALFIPYLYLSIFLCLLGRRDEERPLFVAALALTYAVSFAGYLLVPARGPIVQLQGAFAGPLSGGAFLQLVVDAVASSGGPHGAFPSLHVGASWLLCFFDLRRGQLRGMLYVPLVLGIAVATLVLRYHYLVDLLAGFLISTTAVLAAERIYPCPRNRGSLVSNFWRRTLCCYFSGIQVRGSARLPKDVPVLLLSNHSNAFIDPLILRVALGRRLRLTAKAALLENPMTALLMRLWGVIPLARAQDSDPRERQVHNRQAFEHCFQALDRGEILCLFPEGQSHSEPSLKPLKSGAARLALAYLERPVARRDLVVLPVGLFYDAKERFGSRVLVEIGAPLSLAFWRQAHPEAQAGELTVEFDRQLRILTLNFEDERSSRLLPWLSELFQRRSEEPAPLDQAWCLPEAFIPVTRRFVDAYRALGERPDIRALEKRARTLQEQCERGGIRIEELSLPLHPGKASLFLVRELEMLVGGSLLFAIGLLTNLVPWLLTRLLVRLISRDRDHWATNYLFLGGGLYGFWLLAATALLARSSLAVAAGFVPVAMFSGYFALRYLQRIKRTMKRARIFLLFLLRPGLKTRLQTECRDLTGEIERLYAALTGAGLSGG